MEAAFRISETNERMPVAERKIPRVALVLLKLFYAEPLYDALFIHADFQRRCKATCKSDFIGFHAVRIFAILFKIQRNAFFIRLACDLRFQILPCLIGAADAVILIECKLTMCGSFAK